MNNQDQHAQPHDHDLLTIDEAAGILRTPKATLRYWRHLGTGPRSFRLGRRVLYRADDLREWTPPNTTMTDPTSRENARVRGGRHKLLEESVRTRSVSHLSRR